MKRLKTLKNSTAIGDKDVCFFLYHQVYFYTSLQLTVIYVKEFSFTTIFLKALISTVQKLYTIVCYNILNCIENSRTITKCHVPQRYYNNSYKR